MEVKRKSLGATSATTATSVTGRPSSSVVSPSSASASIKSSSSSSSSSARHSVVSATADGSWKSHNNNSSSSRNNNNNSSSTTTMPTTRAVHAGRILFVTILLTVAVVLGTVSAVFLRHQEVESAESQFEAIHERALDSAVGIAYRKFLGGQAMASVVSHAFPDAEPWPFVSIPGYIDIVSNIVPTSLSWGLNFAPLVQPGEQAEAWEAYAQDEYHKFFGNASTAGMSSFGFGMWATGTDVDTPDHRFHETSGETPWGSPHKVLVPKMHHTIYESPYLMFQTHYPEPHGRAIDSVIECSQKRALSANPNEINCGTISQLTLSNAKHLGPGGLVVMPIYPANDPTTLTGFIVGFLHWREVMEDIFANGVFGVDCILSAAGKSYTYKIRDGKPEFEREGDAHDASFDGLAVSRDLASSGSHMLLPLNNATATYTLTIYPNNELYEAYGTGNPFYATIIVVFAIAFTSVMFFLYDFFVRKDISQKTYLLNAKRQFVRFVSHEVRTPLNSVCMGLSLLQEEMATSLGYRSTDAMLEADKEQRLMAAKRSGDTKGRSVEWFDLAQEVQMNARSSVDVLSDLLNYDKIVSGTLMLELSVVPIWTLIESTIAEFKLPAATKKIDLNFVLPKDGVETAPTLSKAVLDQKVVGDSVRLQQVFRNLASNALKFTPEKGSVTIEAEWIDRNAVPIEKEFRVKGREQIKVPRGGVVRIKVVDSGVGLSQDQLARLFQDGIQFNANELQAGKGSGLGLYIAKGIIQQHGGDLTCWSEGIGKGCCFTLELPLYTIPDPERPETRGEDIENAVTSYEDRSLRILVVDDSTSNRRLLLRLLQNRGHRCDDCEDGHLVVDKVRAAQESNDPFDLILLDFEMPVMNGPTAAKEVREKLGCDVFIAGITGNMLSEDVEYFRENGANAVLPKPFKMSSLEEIIFENNIGAPTDCGGGMVRVCSDTRLNLRGDLVQFSSNRSHPDGTVRKPDDTSGFPLEL